jgi:hypothetical protein
MQPVVKQGHEMNDHIAEYLAVLNNKHPEVNIEPNQNTVMVMIGSDHGAAWWMVTPMTIDVPDSWGNTCSLYVADADALYVEVLWHDDDQMPNAATRSLCHVDVDYDEREALHSTAEADPA